MENIRCCIINEIEAYRGIDREVDMHMFNGEKNCIAYDDALNQYLLYLSIEEQYTPKNAEIILSLSDLINSNYGKSEIVLYDIHPIESIKSLCFLGIDIIDSHLKSIIKKGINKKICDCATNQCNLYKNQDDAQKVIQIMKEKNHKYDDLYCVYVYKLIIPDFD